MTRAAAPLLTLVGRDTTPEAPATTEEPAPGDAEPKP